MSLGVDCDLVDEVRSHFKHKMLGGWIGRGALIA